MVYKIVKRGEIPCKEITIQEATEENKIIGILWEGKKTCVFKGISNDLCLLPFIHSNLNNNEFELFYTTDNILLSQLESVEIIRAFDNYKEAYYWMLDI